MKLSPGIRRIESGRVEAEISLIETISPGGERSRSQAVYLLKHDHQGGEWFLVERFKT